MAALIPGTLIIEDHKYGDKLDISFDIEGIDITGKTLLCHWKTSPGNNPILIFKESDQSITKVILSTSKTSVRIYKPANEMRITPNKYFLTLIMFTNETDTETIMVGSATIVNQITLQP
ncbi:MAG: hypothetical protein JZU65_00655 [Chlorobium sp.]|jgi:hypothetical protein|nr:hypothetical protein [Chlorobium sp.]